MYLDYYGLKEAPFDITPNPRFLFFSAKHREAFNHLLYGIRERKGFVQLTGEVGAGKTTLKAIAMELGLQVKGMDRLETVAEINRFLLQQAGRGKDTVLIIDEAQDLTRELLEQIRLLSNLETDTRKLLQIVLMGQPELRDRLNEHGLRQLRQRICVRYHLQPLRHGEIRQYIQHRLQVSGANGAPHFTGPAVWRIYRYSAGIPRLINTVCDKCLLAGYVLQREKIDYCTVGTAIRELEGHIEV